MSLLGDKLSYYFYFPLKYRLHISVFTIVLMLGFYRLYLKIEPDWVIISVFFIWNFALYLFDRAYDAEKDVISQKLEAISPVEKKPLIWLSVLLSIVPVGILYFAHRPVIPYLFFIPLTFIYTYPVFAGKRVKNFLFIKNFYSAFFIWSLPIIVISIFYVPNVQIDYYSLLSRQLFPLFLYVMIGEAFWDIRDVEGDRINHVNTLPVVFGVVPTKLYLYGLLVIDLATSHFNFSQPLLIYAVLIFFVHSQSPRWVFHLPPLIALFRWFLSLYSQ